MHQPAPVNLPPLRLRQTAATLLAAPFLAASLLAASFLAASFLAASFLAASFLAATVSALVTVPFASVIVPFATAPAVANEYKNPPTKMLWAWQRAEDLSYIDPAEFGVAYLACSVLLTGDTIKCHWRDQPLKVPPGTMMAPVVRIDPDRKHQPAFSKAQIEKLCQVIARAASRKDSALVQIDYDATISERQFYRQLLTRVKQQLPSSLPLSITALASWCIFDNWIKDLPVDETVPMMFSLGGDREKVLLYFRLQRDFLQPSCCRSLGLSIEDPEVNGLMISLLQNRKMPVRIYFFTKTAWTRKKIQITRSLVSKTNNE